MATGEVHGYRRGEEVERKQKSYCEKDSHGKWNKIDAAVEKLKACAQAEKMRMHASFTLEPWLQGFTCRAPMNKYMKTNT